jgi:hypothetical protein
MSGEKEGRREGGGREREREGKRGREGEEKRGERGERHALSSFFSAFQCQCGYHGDSATTVPFGETEHPLLMNSVIAMTTVKCCFSNVFIPSKISLSVE